VFLSLVLISGIQVNVATLRGIIIISASGAIMERPGGDQGPEMEVCESEW
jgi:hypothetical protein